MPIARVLIVADDRPTVTFVEGVVSSLGCTYDMALDLRQAEELALASPVDLLITGATTSVSDDLGLLRRLRRHRPTTKMVILAQTGAPDEVMAAMRDHAFSVCVIPCSTTGLADVIQSALSTPHWQDGIEVISANTHWLEVKACCSAVTADRLVHFMDIVESDLSDEDRHAVGTAFRELLLNAIEHGGRFRPDQHVHVTSVRTPRAVVYMIRDPGEGFLPTALPHAALSNPDEEPTRHAEYRERIGMRPGGFGLLVARGLVDDVVHNERGNGVLLIKYLQPFLGPDAAVDILQADGVAGRRLRTEAAPAQTGRPTR